MAYLMTAALVMCAGCLALTLDGVIPDHWHLLGHLRRGSISSDAHLQRRFHRHADVRSPRVDCRHPQIRTVPSEPLTVIPVMQHAEGMLAVWSGEAIAETLIFVCKGVVTHGL